MPLVLVIGNKNYSSWSMRPWLLLKQAGIPFREKQVWLRETDSAETIQKLSPGGRVPVLIDGRTKVWESLAICEYLAEKYPRAGVWPQDKEARTLARCISNEMHAGFQELRKAMPFNCRARIPLTEFPDAVRGDLARIFEIWEGCRKNYGRKGAFLFGKFTAADAMYAPICLRFQTYGVKLSPSCTAYSQSVINLPAVQVWIEAARKETRRIEESEIKSRRA